MSNNIIFSGVQPTGEIHIGNYLGAISQFVSNQDKYKSIFSIVDLHAITLWQEPSELSNSIRQVLAIFLASGLDPEKNIIFNQSKVPEHTQLAWILSCTAKVGWLNRMTQFKDKAGKNKEISPEPGLYRIRKKFEKKISWDTSCILCKYICRCKSRNRCMLYFC